MQPLQLAFLPFIVCRMFLSSLTLTTFLTRSVELVFSILLQPRFSKLPGIFDLLSEVSRCQHFISFFFIFKSNLLVKRIF